MNKIILLLVLIVVFFTNCQQKEKEVPKCIKDSIVEFENSQPCNNIQIDEYIFQSNKVYVFNQGTFKPVVDKDCNQLGILGGFAGNNQINGESFLNAEFVKTIWKNQC